MRKNLWILPVLLVVFTMAFAFTACTGTPSSTTSARPAATAAGGDDYSPVAGEVSPLPKAGFTPIAIVGLERTMEDVNTGKRTEFPMTDEMKIQLTGEEIQMLNDAPKDSFIRVYVRDTTGWMSGTWFNGADGKYDATTTDQFKFTAEGGRRFVDHELSFFIPKISEGGNAIALDTEVVLQKWGGDFMGVFLYKTN